jgi:integrase
VVALDPEVVQELAALYRPDETGFVVDSPWRARADSLRRYYRCQPVFDRLIVWLKANGITSQKPLHELRKEVGALIATREGIYAASHFLGHSDITTTARHYAAMQRPVTAGIGALLESGSGHLGDLNCE